MSEDHLPTVQDGLSALFEGQGNLPVVQGSFERTDDFVNSIVESLPAEQSLSDIDSVREELLQQFHTRESGVLIRDYIVNRSSQIERLAKLGPDVLLELIAAGMPQSRLCKKLSVSPAVLDTFLQRTCSPEALRRAEELLADMLIEEGRERLEEADENTKAGVTKATEIAKNNHLIAKALSNRYVDKKVDTQINQQFNGLDGVLPTEGEDKQGWLRIVVPDKDDLPPLKEVRGITKQHKHETDPANFEEGVFTIEPMPDEPS